MKIRFPAICAVLLCLAVNTAGQEAARDFRFVYDTNPYLNLGNPAAISFWDGRIATAEVSFGKKDGGLRDISESSDSWEVVAGTESYFRVSDLIAFHGKVAWSDFSGKDMGGPIMMFPGYDPVNFLESTVETAGRKQRELYTLCGEIALSPGRRWGIGIGVNYQAGDQTKVKDPRFSNIWMDLDVNAGVTFAASDFLQLGAAFRWRNTLENVKGHIYGTTDRQYFICTDKGGFFGTVAELTGDYNYIPDSTPRPMNNDWIGGSLQVILGGVFSSDFSYLKRSGYYGKKSSTTATFFEFGGMKAGYEGLLALPVEKNMHRAAVSVSYEQLTNNENQFRYTTPEGGNTIVEYTGQNQICNIKTLSAAVDYRWLGNIKDGGRAATTIGVRGGWHSTGITTIVYPFWRTQSIKRIDAELYCQKNFFSGSNIFTADLSAFGLYGFGSKKIDGTYVATTSTSLRSFDNYLDKHYEFETAPRAGASLAFTYTRVMKHLAPWIKVADSLTSLIAAPEFLTGRTRNVFTVSIGCNF